MSLDILKDGLFLEGCLAAVGHSGIGRDFVGQGTSVPIPLFSQKSFRRHPVSLLVYLHPWHRTLLPKSVEQTI